MHGKQKHLGYIANIMVMSTELFVQYLLNIIINNKETFRQGILEILKELFQNFLKILKKCFHGTQTIVYYYMS